MLGSVVHVNEKMAHAKKKPNLKKNGKRLRGNRGAHENKHARINRDSTEIIGERRASFTTLNTVAKLNINIAPNNESIAKERDILMDACDTLLIIRRRQKLNASL